MNLNSKSPIKLVRVTSNFVLFSFSFLFLILKFLPFFSIPPNSLWVLFLLACKQVDIIKVGRWRIDEGTFWRSGEKNVMEQVMELRVFLYVCLSAWLQFMLVCYQNCDQKCTRQDLADKKERNGKQKKTKIYVCTSLYTVTHSRMIKIIASTWIARSNNSKGIL